MSQDSQLPEQPLAHSKQSRDCIYCEADAYFEESHGQWECDFGHRFSDPEIDSSLILSSESPTSEPASSDPALDKVLADLRREVTLARAQHAPMHSPHEGWAVIREELEPELWSHVCDDTGRSAEARKEALQVAAMGIRYILDLIDDPPSFRDVGSQNYEG